MKNHINRRITVKTGILLLTLTCSTFIACSQTTTEKKDQCESPYFAVISEDGENEQLPLKSTRVDVNIAGVIADVEVKQTYSNTGKKPIEAVYVFPASTRAAVYNMVMKIDDREIIALVEEKKQARQMYEDAKKEGKTASLLEEHRPNVFQMNVANIMPGATIEVSLSYTELLVPTDKIYEFVYPTVVGPRYVSKGEVESETAENWAANPYLKEGELPPSTLDIDVNIAAGMPIQNIRCETHKNNINYTGKASASITLDDKQGGNRDFVVQYRLAGNSIESGVLVYEGPKGEKYFLAMMQPPNRVAPNLVAPREYVFVIDVSGSMSGFPLDVSKEIMKNLLNGLKETDKFNIVLFAGGSKVYSEKSLPATANNISNAINYMDNLRGGGGTELLNALRTAMKLNNDDNYSRSFVILTDGYVTVEKEAFDYIRNNLGNANFFAFGIGSSVNRFLIEGLAHVGYGEPFIALNKQEGKKQANKFVKYVSAPVLTDINISFSGIETFDVLPEKMPDLFAERPLIVSGKFKGSARGSIKVSGKSGKIQYNKNWNISQNMTSKQTKALKYLWAREKVRLLSDYNKIDGNEELKSEIINLGKTYNLLTEYTSFVAIDSEISNPDASNLTRVKQPSPLPQGVSNLALSRYAAAPRSAKRLKMAEQEVDYELSVEFEEVQEEMEEEVFVIVETMPQFRGGDISKFREYVQEKVVYPEEAIKKGISGRVFVQFVVDVTGKVAEIKIVRGVDPLLDNEVIRILKDSPKWKPGNQRGKPVKVSFTIPVEFSLNKK